MLGLGNSVISSSYNREFKLLSTYTSDFTSGLDSWGAYSVQGTLTLQANQTAPGSGEAGWLKGTFDTNQDNQAGIVHNNPFGSLSLGPPGYHEITMKVYLDNPSGSLGDYWGGTDDVTTYCIVNNKGINSAVAQEQVVNFSGSSVVFTNVIVNTGEHDAAIYWISSGDRPAANAVFYIKDIVWKVYGYTNL